MVSYVRHTIAQIPSLLIPIWMRNGFHYTRTDARADIVAGITVAIIQIPQSMAFALTAGLPAVYGLYASLVGCIAGLWGSSRQLSTGPVAMVSLLTLTSLVSLAAPESVQFIRLAATLALLTGIIYLALGFSRMGQLIHLVPHSVIAGFSTAAAVLIVISQIPTLLGIPSPQYDVVLQNIVALVRAIPQLSLLTSMVGILSLGFLIITRRLPRSYPTALILLAGVILISYLFHLDAHSVAIVGFIPSVLPRFVLPHIGSNTLSILLPKAAVLALVAFVATHANTKTLARSTHEHLDSDQELVGQGLANVITAFFQGFPISGSFTRSAINHDSGARTAFSSVVSAIMTVVAILFLTPLFYYLPRTALAAIVLLSAYSLVDFKRLGAIYDVSRSDGIVALFTFTMVFVLTPENALFAGMLLALVLFIRQTVWGAQVSEVGIDMERGVLRSTLSESAVRIFPSVVIARISMSLYYANTGHIISEIDTSIETHIAREMSAVKHLVLDMSGVNFMDITGMEMFEEYLESLYHRHINVSMIYVRAPVFTLLQNTSYFPHRSIFYNVQEMRMKLQLL